MKKILLVDDEEMIREMVGGFLKDSLGSDVEVIIASDGDEAVRMTQSKQPKVILLDFTLHTPLEGFPMLEKVREAAPQAKIFLMSGALDLEGKEVKRHGGDGFIGKPIQMELLLELIQKEMSGA